MMTGIRKNGVIRYHATYRTVVAMAENGRSKLKFRVTMNVEYEVTARDTLDAEIVAIGIANGCKKGSDLLHQEHVIYGPHRGSAKCKKCRNVKAEQIGGE